MQYWEDLPDQCPPVGAQDVAIEPAYRIVFSQPPHKEHFASHKKLGRMPTPETDECRFASCSLFLKLAPAKKLAGLPKIRAKGGFIAKLAIPTGAGMSFIKNQHVDFWMFDGFDPISATVEVEPA